MAGRFSLVFLVQQFDVVLVNQFLIWLNGIMYLIQFSCSLYLDRYCIVGRV